MQILVEIDNVCQSYGKETNAPRFADLSMVAVSPYFKRSMIYIYIYDNLLRVTTFKGHEMVLSVQHYRTSLTFTFCACGDKQQKVISSYQDSTDRTVDRQKVTVVRIVLYASARLVLCQVTVKENQPRPIIKPTKISP